MNWDWGRRSGSASRSICPGSKIGRFMADLIFNIVKAPVGWVVHLDCVRIGGVYGTKEAAFEAAMVAASFAVRDGEGVHISVRSDAKLRNIETTQPWPKEWNAFLKR
jgi:hypothetical protein